MSKHVKIPSKMLKVTIKVSFFNFWFNYPGQSTIAKLLIIQVFVIVSLFNSSKLENRKSLSLIVSNTCLSVSRYTHTCVHAYVRAPRLIWPRETSGTITIKCSKHLHALSLWVNWTWTDPHHSHHWRAHRGLILNMTVSHVLLYDFMQ